jgi:hypothetical protein
MTFLGKNKKIELFLFSLSFLVGSSVETFAMGAEKNYSHKEVEKALQLKSEVDKIAFQFKTYQAVQSGLSTQGLPVFRNPLRYDVKSQRQKFLQLTGEISEENRVNFVALPPTQSRARVLDRIKNQLREQQFNPNIEKVKGMCLGTFELFDAEDETLLLCAKTVANLSFLQKSAQSKDLLFDFVQDRAHWSLNQGVLVALILAPAMAQYAKLSEALELIRSERERSKSSTQWTARSHLVEGQILYGMGRTQEAMQIWRSLTSEVPAAVALKQIVLDEVDTRTQSHALLSLARSHKVRGQLTQAAELYARLLSEPIYFQEEESSAEQTLFLERIDLPFLPENSVSLKKDQLKWEYSETLVILGRSSEALAIQNELQRTASISSLRTAANLAGDAENLSALKRLADLRRNDLSQDLAVIDEHLKELNSTELWKKEPLIKFLRVKAAHISVKSVCELNIEVCKKPLSLLNKWAVLLENSKANAGVEFANISKVSFSQLRYLNNEVPRLRKLFDDKTQRGIDLLLAVLKETTALLGELNRSEDWSKFDSEILSGIVASRDRVFKISEELKDKSTQFNSAAQILEVESLQSQVSETSAKIASLRFLVSLESEQQLLNVKVGRVSIRELLIETDGLQEQVFEQAYQLALSRLEVSQAAIDLKSQSVLKSSVLSARREVQNALLAKFIGSLETRAEILPSKDVLSQSIRDLISACGNAFREIKSSGQLESRIYVENLRAQLSEIRSITERVSQKDKLFESAKLSELIGWKQDIVSSLVLVRKTILREQDELKLSLSALSLSGAELENKKEEMSLIQLKSRERVRALRRWKLESGVLR